MIRAATIQLTCTSDAEANIACASHLIRQAATRGASLIVTPENTNFLGPHDAKVATAEPIDGPTCTHFLSLARELGITLVLGSFNERSEDPARCYNTSVVFGRSPSGQTTVLGSYRKIHLFDVNLPPDVVFLESRTVIPGDQTCVVATEAGVLGLSICYDLRFPGLYTELIDQGAEILLVPSAFTATTGRAHWKTLLVARAIENQCYVIAPGQVGRHDDNGLRESYGHSMMIDPWGAVLSELGDEPGVGLANLELARVREVRARMPVQQHRRR